MNKKIISFLMVSALVALGVSCSKDNFTDSIFSTSTEPVDKSVVTAPFDQWLYDNFVVPYNTEIQYKFNFPASNLDFQLAPADYKKSQLLSHFIKYLFYDVYTKFAGEDFMKQYGPRMFHFIGSTAFAPTTGTRTLGYASGGVKITLINVNNLRLWTADNPYTGADVEQLNRDQFHTMHHEFSHILHQTKSYPSAFGLVTAGNYDPRTWGERDSVETNSLGYLTNYGSSATYEDFVETLSCTITDSDYAWMNYIINACMNTGIDDKQKVYDLIDSLGIANLDNPGKPWNNFTVKKESVLNTETNKYEETGRYISSFHENNVKIQNEAKNITARYTNVKSFTSFRDYLDNWVESTGNPNAGINAILTKIETARKWHQEKWGLELFALRREVRARQDKINDYVKANVTIYDY